MFWKNNCNLNMYIPIAVAPDGGRVAHPHHGEQASFKYKRTLWLGPTDGSLIWQGDLLPFEGLDQITRAVAITPMLYHRQGAVDQ